MKRVLLADSDKGNLALITRYLSRCSDDSLPEYWEGRQAYSCFIREPEDGAVFIRIDDPLIPGLVLTDQALSSYPKMQIVWMAASESYVIDAFPRGVDAYLLLPATDEKLADIMDSLDFKKKRYSMQ
ncbi:MAG: hypothetical protein HGA22_09465 [Clostridiales bacterium]|nr:hypothetical protein [Clostridiales bacterium]